MTATVDRLACIHCKARNHDSKNCKWPSMAGLDPVEFAQKAVTELSERQRDVLRWIASDLTEESIAKVMRLSVHTVRSYRKQVYVRLGVGSAVGATAVAFRAGLVK